MVSSRLDWLIEDHHTDRQTDRHLLDAFHLEHVYINLTYHFCAVSIIPDFTIERAT